MIQTQPKTMVWPLLAVALVLLGAPGLRAQGNDPAVARAQKLFSEGETRYRLGRFKEALSYYEKAYRQAQLPNIVFNIAQCHRLLKNFERALFFYKVYLSDYRRHYRQRPPNLAAVRTLIARVEGEHKLAQERKQRLLQQKQARQRQAELERQRQRTMEKLLDRPGATAPPKSDNGRLWIEGLKVADARVVVDSVPLAVAPILRPLELRPGQHKVRVEASGHLPWQQLVQVPRGGELRLAVQLRPRPRKSRLLLASTIGCVVLAAGAEAMGVVYTVKTDNSYQGTVTFDRNRTLMITGHTLAGVLAAASVVSLVFYLCSDRVEEIPTTTAGVAPLPGGVALTGQVRF